MATTNNETNNTNNVNKKSIRFLRGGINYDPKTSDVILEDGQPFYSHKTKQLYIGYDQKPIKDLKGTEIGLNLENGEGQGSLQQRLFEDGTKNAKATGLGAIAFGGFRGDKPNNQPNEDDTTVTAEGIQSFAQGCGSHALGNWSIAMGKDSVAYQKGSIAIGDGCKAGNPNGNVNDYDRSFAVGAGNTASGKGSVAMNEENTAAGPQTFVAGYSNVANSSRSAVFGEGNISKSTYQFILGCFNDNQSDNIFEVGNGNAERDENGNAISSSITRKNAFTVKRGGGFNSFGKSYVSGTLTVRPKDDVEVLLEAGFEKDNKIVNTFVVKTDGGFKSCGDSEIEGALIVDDISRLQGDVVVGDGKVSKTLTVLGTTKSTWGSYGEMNVNSNLFVNGDSDLKGRVTVSTAPVEDTDVVRLKELNSVADKLIYATNEDIDMLWAI